MKTVISVRRVIRQINLALQYSYKLVLKPNFFIIWRSNPGHSSPWIDLIIALASDKILNNSDKFSIKTALNHLLHH